MKEFIKKNERYIKTFIEAVASFIAVNIITDDLTDKEALKGLIMGAIASAISVVVNIEKKEKITTELTDRQLKKIYGEIPVEPDVLEIAPVTHEEGETHE